MKNFRQAKDESSFSLEIRDAVNSLDFAIPRALPRGDPFAPSVPEEYWKKIRSAVEQLWPARVRPLFKGKDEARAYQEAWISAAYSPFWDCLRISALWCAGQPGRQALLEAVRQADAVPRQYPPAASPLLKAVERGPHNPYLDEESALDKYREVFPKGSFTPPIDTCMKLGRLVVESRRKRPACVSAWDVFRCLPPTLPHLSCRWLTRTLLGFADACARLGIRIKKIPAACAAFLGRDASIAIRSPAVRSFFLLPPKKDFSIDVRAPAGMTLLGYLFYAFSKTGEYEAVFIVSESLLRAFSGEPKLLRRFKESPGYQLFLKAAVQEEPTPKGRRDWLGERRSLEGNPRVGALLRHLFGKILPGWNRLGQASFLVELAKGARANCYFPRGYQRSLLLVSSERQKRRLEESGHWLRLFDLKDGFRKGAANWKFILLQESWDTVWNAKDRLQEELTAEKDASAYLRFVARHHPSGDLSLDFYNNKKIKERFIYDFHGSPLWEKAGGACLEPQEAEALCFAWGSASFRGRAGSLAPALEEVGPYCREDLLALMLTPAGLRRCRGALLRVLPRASADAVRHIADRCEEGVVLRAIALHGPEEARVPAALRAYDQLAPGKAAALGRKLFLAGLPVRLAPGWLDRGSWSAEKLFLALCELCGDPDRAGLRQALEACAPEPAGSRRLSRKARLIVARLAARAARRFEPGEAGAAPGALSAREVGLAEWLLREARCCAWGAASYNGPGQSIAPALNEIGPNCREDLLALMLTPAGVRRGGGALLRVLHKAPAEAVLEIIDHCTDVEVLQAIALHGPKEARVPAARQAFDRLRPQKAIELAKKFFLAGLPVRLAWGCRDVKSWTREKLFLALCASCDKRDANELCEVLDVFARSFQGPDAEAAARGTLEEVARLAARAGRLLVSAEAGLVAGLWPGKQARIVKWLISAMDWKAAPGCRLQKSYRRFHIPKKHGGKRLISEPIKKLKFLQRGVLERLIAPLGAHPAAMGFVAGKSIADNASVHSGQPVVAVADVHNCFPSVAWPVLYRVLERDLGPRLGAPACALIADLCTLDGGLPMGSPASPALLNRVLFKADEILASEAKRKGCRYTRYADDLAFSGGEGAVGLIARAGSVLSAAGLRLDPKKSSVFRRGRRQVVTGLTVNAKPDVSRDYRRRVRAAADRWRKGLEPSWLGCPVTREQLLGRIAFVNMTSAEEAVRLRKWMREGDRLRGKKGKAA